MNRSQAWRGPDAEGLWADPQSRVHLGHMRLSIIDHEGGAQPMWTADSAVGVVFNGEIYNHAELRTELKQLGANFLSDHSDTEVLLHAYRTWGDAFVGRLNGMWAFVIYDRARRRLFASRDRFGKKPFYYAHQPDFFAFASELTALSAHPRVSRTVSPLAVRKFFAYGYVPAPHSIYQGVKKLPGGHCLEYDLASASLRTWKYWDLVIEPFEEAPVNAEERWCEELRALLKRAVKRRLIADVPIGAFLSGGIDSSAVAAYAAHELGADGLNTYSIGFEEPSFDESTHAARVARLVRSVHHVKTLSIEAARAVMPEVLSRLDEPLADSSLLPTYLLCGYARQHVTVALGGDGGDELFGGYDPFRALRWADLYAKWVPRPLHRAISLAIARMPVSHRNMSLDFKLKRTLRGLDHAASLWCPVWMAPLGPRDLLDCFRERVELEEVYSEAIEHWESARSPALVDRTLQFYTKLYLQDDILAKVDRASMMHSLEVRAPFLDIELVDFARRIPWQYKVRGGETKYLLKKALANVLPRDILYRPKKGFGVPVGEWFRTGALTLSGGGVPGIEPRCVTERLAVHRRGARDERSFLWSALTMASFTARSADRSCA